jgi:hypothetical protein
MTRVSDYSNNEVPPRSPLRIAAKWLGGSPAEVQLFIVETDKGFATGLRVGHGRLAVLDDAAVACLWQLLEENRAAIDVENRAAESAGDG